jgi:hypothetical protein
VLTLLIRRELAVTEGQPEFVWWATTHSVPGFVAADDSLQGLIARAKYALFDIFKERGEELPDIRFELTADPPASDNPVSVVRSTSERGVEVDSRATVVA